MMGNLLVGFKPCLAAQASPSSRSRSRSPSLKLHRKDIRSMSFSISGLITYWVPFLINHVETFHPRLSERFRMVTRVHSSEHFQHSLNCIRCPSSTLKTKKTAQVYQDHEGHSPKKSCWESRILGLVGVDFTKYLINQSIWVRLGTCCSFAWPRLGVYGWWGASQWSTDRLGVEKQLDQCFFFPSSLLPCRPSMLFLIQWTCKQLSLQPQWVSSSETEFQRVLAKVRHTQKQGFLQYSMKFVGAQVCMYIILYNSFMDFHGIARLERMFFTISWLTWLSPRSRHALAHR